MYYNTKKKPCQVQGYSGLPGGIRTPDPVIRSDMLYPTELRAEIVIYRLYASRGDSRSDRRPDSAHTLGVVVEVERR
jgi:hypothetical protein